MTSLTAGAVSSVGLRGPVRQLRSACLVPRTRSLLQRDGRQVTVPVARSSARQISVACSATSTEPAVADNGAAPAGEVPRPVVRIDNQHDPFATVVEIQYGDRLGELLDTIAALKNLNLNIRRAKIKAAGPTAVNRFYITDAATSEKILKSARLEEIRLTILNNLLKYHPESEASLAWGGKVARQETSRDATAPLGPKARRVVKTSIRVTEDDSGSHSEVFIETQDRPGLLTDIVRVMKDISVNVVSAEVDTEGASALDTFYVTYRGEPLPPPMVQLLTNAMQYHLSLGEVEREESY